MPELNFIFMRRQRQLCVFKRDENFKKRLRKHVIILQKAMYGPLSSNSRETVPLTLLFLGSERCSIGAQPAR
jgi:hypothetical protein